MEINNKRKISAITLMEASASHSSRIKKQICTGFNKNFQHQMKAVPMHVVVTGGAGYIGSVLVPLLLDQGYRVTIYDKLVHGVQPILHFTHHKLFSLVCGDVNDLKGLKDVIVTADAVIHLAAIVGFPACDQDPDLAEKVNVGGTRAVVSLLSPHQNLVYASTGSCYGAVDGICTESTQINPLSVYGHTKAQGEKMVLAAGGVALRLATVFGKSPRLRLDLLVNDLTVSALKNKNISIYESHAKRTFLHVRDAANAFLFALSNFHKMKGQAFNVGDEQMNLTKGEVAMKIQSLIKDCHITPGSGKDNDKRDYKVSYDKINHLGFKSSINLEQGIQELITVIPFLTDDDIERARNAN